MPWILHLLPVVASLLPTLAQSSHTFLTPGKSFLEYQPTWNSATNQRIEMVFRTEKANAMLLQYTITDVAAGDYQPELLIELFHGQLLVTFRYEDYKEVVSTSKGLNHDKWHNVGVELSALKNSLSVQVDNRNTKTIVLKSMQAGKLTKALGTGDKQALVTVGGFSPDSHHQPSSFIGCIRDIRFYSDDVLSDVQITRKGAVHSGCKNQCNNPSGAAPCHNDGRCINHYTHVSCDCFQTGFQGDFCEIEEVTTVTLQGSEWLTYRVYQTKEERSHSPTSRVALQFRTSYQEGILFYAREHSPQYNHLAVSLHNASIHVSVVFVDQASYNELFVTMGSGLDDNRWHSVVVSHQGKEVEVTLDDDVEKMTSDHTHPHLHIPPTVFYGGMDVTTQVLGLRSTENFIGCLRMAYFNHASILEQINTTRTVHHGNQVQYGCQNLNETCLQFTHNGAFLKVSHPVAQFVEVELEFRTLKKDGLLLYATIEAGTEKGYMQLVLIKGTLSVYLVSHPEHPSLEPFITMGINLHDNSWHEVKVAYKNGLVRVTLDSQTSVMAVKTHVKLGKETYLGFAPSETNMEGYIGCLRSVHLQGVKVEPLAEVHSQGAVGVTLGTCDLHNWCLPASPCLHGGVCVAEWAEAYCDCSHTHYEGKHCQFSKLWHSCAELHQAGHTESGVWLIDPSGYNATYAYCEMSGVPKTTVQHNLQPKSVVRGPGLEDHKKILVYREMDRLQLSALVSASANCSQSIQVTCKQSPLRLGHDTWFTASTGREFSSLGGIQDKTCGCDVDGTCVEDKLSCNCDAESKFLHTDGGTIMQKSHLPVVEMAFLQHSTGQTNITLGPLVCTGTKNEVPSSYVMFSEATPSIQVPGWFTGNVRFSFRTLKRDAVLLYQGTSQEGSEEIQLLVAMVDEQYLRIELHRPSVKDTVFIPEPLNNGQWQYVTIEVTSDQVRVTVGRHRFLLDAVGDSEERPVGIIDDMLVGGSISSGHHSIGGLVGCLGALEIDGVTMYLADMIPKGESGIHEGCSAACDNSPCHNGATCEEFWTSYHCQCADPIAHSGHNCQINIDEDEVHLEGEATFLEFHDLETIDSGDMLLSFRSLQHDALLLYVQDENNNFIQVELRDGDKLAVVYNYEYQILEMNITVPGLNDGSWKRVILKIAEDDALTVSQGKISSEAGVFWKRMTSYSQKPFNIKESVFPIRTLNRQTGMKVYVGGVPASFSKLEGLQGCVRGLVVAGTQLYLAQASEDMYGQSIGCPSGCDKSPCNNNGGCVDHPNFDGNFVCQCSESGFAGALCDTETGVSLDGSSWIMQSYSPMLKNSDDIGQMEQISFLFASKDQKVAKRGMVFVRGQGGLSDYMAVYLTEAGTVAADVDIKGHLVSVETELNVLDDKSHYAVLTRSGSLLTLTVDNSEVSTSFNETVVADTPAFVIIGGIKPGNFRESLNGFDNYTGSIANVFVLSDQFAIPPNLSPLDSYFGFRKSITEAQAIGNVRLSERLLSQKALDKIAPTLDTVQGQHPESKAFPVWEMEEAETVMLLPVGKMALKAEPEDEEGIKLHGSIGFIVCAGFLSILGIAIGFIYYRHITKHRTQGAGGGRDEEEAVELLDVEPSTTSPDMQHFRAVHVRRDESKRKKSPTHQDEDEDTPMLSTVQPIATTESLEEEHHHQQEMAVPPAVSKPAAVEREYDTANKTPQKWSEAPPEEEEEPTWDPSVDSGAAMYSESARNLDKDIVQAQDSFPTSPLEQVLVDIHAASDTPPSVKRASMYSSTDTFMTATEGGGSIAQLDNLEEHFEQQQQQHQVSDDGDEEEEEEEDQDDDKDKTLTPEQGQLIKDALGQKHKRTIGVDNKSDMEASFSSLSSEASTVREASSPLNSMTNHKPTHLPDIVINQNNISQECLQTSSSQVPDEDGDDEEEESEEEAEQSARLLPAGSKPLQPPVNGYSPGIPNKKISKTT